MCPFRGHSCVPKRGVRVLGKIIRPVVATQRFFMFTPNLGEMIKFDEHIFQMGGNHQLV